MTRAICMAVYALDVPVVDDADDRRHRSGARPDRTESGFPAANEEHVLADAGADRIDRDERAAGGLAGGGQRLQHEQLEAGQFVSLRVDDDVADDARDLHVSFSRL